MIDITPPARPLSQSGKQSSTEPCLFNCGLRPSVIASHQYAKSVCPDSQNTEQASKYFKTLARSPRSRQLFCKVKFRPNDERTGVAFTVADSSKDEQALLRSSFRN